MPTVTQIRGMLLEEAILHLLRVSGYRTIEQVGSDPTLNHGAAGLEVKGRGGVHQIDAIADYTVAHPFSYPQRLLVEAKCYSDTYPVGIEKIRNAVGVLKDVEEYWVSRGKNGPFKKRYHYQFAFFSASGYTADAEAYAYAQDIYLIPLARSHFIHPLIQSIRSLRSEDFGVESSRRRIDLSLTELRRAIRSAIRDSSDYNSLAKVVHASRAREKLYQIILECQKINQAILAMIARQIPIFLVPSFEIDITWLEDQYRVRIHWDQQGWYLRDANNNRELFSFDLPPTLFELYARQGTLSRADALQLKADFFPTMQAVVTVREQVRVITFNLDMDWLTKLRRQTRKLSNLPEIE